MLRKALMTGAATAALLLFAGALQAQSLDGMVVRNPNDTVTYTLDVSGPPNGRAALYVSLFVLDPPLISPSLGIIHLDPAFWLRTTPFQVLPPTGQHQFQFQVPENLTTGLPLSFQSLNIDTFGTLRFSQNFLSLIQNEFHDESTASFDYAMSYDSKDAGVDLAGVGSPGALVEALVIDGGGVRHVLATTVASDGTYVLAGPVPGGLTDADVVDIVVDGVLKETIDLFKP